jgi:hypothetical protein
MKLVVVFFVCLGAIVFAKPTENLKEWQAFKVKFVLFFAKSIVFQWLIIHSNMFYYLQLEHGKNYSSVEDNTRFATYLRTKELIKEHNERFAQGKETYEMGINEFADMEHEEFLGAHTGAIVPQIAKKPK